MPLPKANCSFTIPSIHDDLELDCRLYYPRRSDGNSDLFGGAFAVFAHPYASLGGSYDDPVVGVAGDVLLRAGCMLVTFNFRGATGSAGKTSWSAKAELGDYVSVYGLMLCYIDALYRKDMDGEGWAMETRQPVLVLGGYSYGSMIASHLPSRSTVVGLFTTPTADTAEHEIQLRANQLARDGRAYLEMHSTKPTQSIQRGRSRPGDRASKTVMMGGYDSDAAGSRISRESSRKSLDGEKIKQSVDKIRHRISTARRSTNNQTEAAIDREGTVETTTTQWTNPPRVAYVLISPLLPPVAAFTTMFSKLRFRPRNPNLSSTTVERSPDEEEFGELVKNPCLCIYGSKDMFTSDRKLQRWAEELQSRSGSRFVAIRTGAGHFWHETSELGLLKQGLAEWLRSLRHEKEQTESAEPDTIASQEARS